MSDTEKLALISPAPWPYFGLVDGVTKYQEDREHNPEALLTMKMNEETLSGMLGYLLSVKQSNRELTAQRQAVANELDFAKGGDLTQLALAVRKLNGDLFDKHGEWALERRRAEELQGQLSKETARTKELEEKCARLEKINERQQIALLNFLGA